MNLQCIHSDIIVISCFEKSNGLKRVNKCISTNFGLLNLVSEKVSSKFAQYLTYHTNMCSIRYSYKQDNMMAKFCSN